jgi:hypothetical protein
MSRQNKVNPDHYTVAGRLSPDDLARERQKQNPQRTGARRGRTAKPIAPWMANDATKVDGDSQTAGARAETSEQPADKGSSGTLEGVERRPDRGERNAPKKTGTSGTPRTSKAPRAVRSAARAASTQRAVTAGARKASNRGSQNVTSKKGSARGPARSKTTAGTGTPAKRAAKPGTPKRGVEKRVLARVAKNAGTRANK